MEKSYQYLGSVGACEPTFDELFLKVLVVKIVKEVALEFNE